MHRNSRDLHLTSIYRDNREAAASKILQGHTAGRYHFLQSCEVKFHKKEVVSDSIKPIRHLDPPVPENRPHSIWIIFLTSVILSADCIHCDGALQDAPLVGADPYPKRDFIQLFVMKLRRANSEGVPKPPDALSCGHAENDKVRGCDTGSFSASSPAPIGLKPFGKGGHVFLVDGSPYTLHSCHSAAVAAAQVRGAAGQRRARQAD